MSKNIVKLAALAITPLMLVGCSVGNVDSLPLDNPADVAIQDYSSHNNENVNSVFSPELPQSHVNEIHELVNGVDFQNVVSSFGSSSVGGGFDFPDTHEDIFTGRTVVTVDYCDLTGDRKPNVVVDVGYGERDYWAYTNEHGQLTGIIADEIIPQYKHEELSNGRYCWDEAKVPGTESPDLDEGHVIADSLGGVANAYNITPQDSYLNRYGEQSKMERRIANAGGAKDFTATINYPNTYTQTPSSYEFTFTLNDGTTESISFRNQ